MSYFEFNEFKELNKLESFLKTWYFEVCDKYPQIDGMFEPGFIYQIDGARVFLEKLMESNGVNANDSLYTAFNGQLEDRLRAGKIISMDDPARFFENPGSRGMVVLDVDLRYHARYFPLHYHCHSFYELVFLVRGTCIHYAGDDVIEMRTGDIVIIPPETMHTICSRSDENIIFNMSIRTSTFEQNFNSLLNSQNVLGKFFNQTLYSTKNKQSYFIFRTGDYLLGDNILADMYLEIQSDNSYKRDILNTQCKLLFLHLLRNYSDSMFAALINSGDSDILVDILKYIQNNFKNVTLDELSDKFNYSKRQIIRFINEYTGSSLRELKKQLRMHHAVDLLANSDLTVEEISIDCGYENTGNFCAAFKKEYNKTPLVYRKLYRV